MTQVAKSALSLLPEDAARGDALEHEAALAAREIEHLLMEQKETLAQ